MATSASESHELTAIEGEQWTDSGHALQSLPRADGGRQAWLFLFSCFMLEALVWGFPFAYGVFQVYYSTHEPFAKDKTVVASIGTTQTGLMYFSTPIVALIMQRWPQIRRPGMWVGAAVMVISLIAASFCNSVDGLLATQAVLYALGGLTVYFPAMPYIDEWFIRRKGMAYGVMWAGSGSAGVVVPFVLQWLLDSYGFRTALRAWAVILAVCMTPCLLFVKGRLPVAASSSLRPNDLRFMKQLPFWIFLAGAVLQSFAFFLPPLWIPSFALAIGLPKFAGPLGLAMLNLTTCFGAILVGMLVDRFHISVAITFSTLGQMITIFVFWGIASSQPTFYIFALLWGLFGGGFSASWSGYAKVLSRSNPNGHTDLGLVVALMAGGRGVGAVITGPLSERLLALDWKSHASLAYGTSYAVLIVFSGVFATLGGAACVGRLFKVI